VRFWGHLVLGLTLLVLGSIVQLDLALDRQRLLRLNQLSGLRVESNRKLLGNLGAVRILSLFNLLKDNWLLFELLKDNLLGNNLLALQLNLLADNWQLLKLLRDNLLWNLLGNNLLAV